MHETALRDVRSPVVVVTLFHILPRQWWAPPPLRADPTAQHSFGARISSLKSRRCSTERSARADLKSPASGIFIHTCAMNPQFSDSGMRATLVFEPDMERL